ncbi:MAG: hypothetical protein HYU37_18145 [Acidobacteria bacterium]|nr:hypothetical protein [Acidobacteriota bacterium]
MRERRARVDEAAEVERRNARVRVAAVRGGLQQLERARQIRPASSASMLKV